MTAALVPTIAEIGSYRVSYNLKMRRWAVYCKHEQAWFEEIEDLRGWLVERMVPQELLASGFEDELAVALELLMSRLTETPAVLLPVSALASRELDQGRYLAWSVPYMFHGHREVKRFDGQLQFESYHLESLRTWLWFYSLSVRSIELAAQLEDAMDPALLELAMSVPYPQECQCQDYKHGLVANDCHVHNEYPRHFFGDFDFDCTCP